MRCLLFCLFLCVPHVVTAACSGTDLSETLTPAQQDELTTAMDAMPYATGNHWVAQKGTRRLHVIGTLHVNDPRMAAVTQRLAPLVQDADLLLLEATTAEEKKLQEVMAKKPDMAFITQGPTLLELMEPDDWDRISQAASARGIPPFMAAKFQPWLLSLTLGIPACVLQRLNAGETGLDRKLDDIASTAGVPTRALEPFDTIFRIFAQDPIQEQVKYLSLFAMTEAQSLDGLQTVLEQYFDENHGAIIDLSRITGRDMVDLPADEFDAVFEDTMGDLLGARNRAWMSVIAQASGDTIVIAVGAAHLSGEDGVLNLLAQDGYDLTRQPF